MNSECLSTLQDYFVGLQLEYCSAFAAIDGKEFLPDPWVRARGGHGNSQVLSQGSVFEKAGVNFSRIFDQSLPASATLKRPELAGCSFEAMGISLVLHPLNPHVPTAHANLRFFCAQKPDGSYLWWFGGGFDLTPYYGYEEDCVHWHQTAKAACDPFGLDIYPKLKTWCDSYFYLNHRQEPRGIGGLFFDDLNEWPFETCFAFVRSLGNHFMQAYLPIVKRRMATSYTQSEKDFQLYRRGRYVEFNLVQDRGTLFGLQSGGRTESILMSMPPEVRWHYNWQALPASPEARLTEYYLTARDWLKEHQKILSLSS